MKKETHKKRISITLDMDIIKAVQDNAKKEERTISNMIEVILKRAFQEQKDC